MSSRWQKEKKNATLIYPRPGLSSSHQITEEPTNQRIAARIKNVARMPSGSPPDSVLSSYMFIDSVKCVGSLSKENRLSILLLEPHSWYFYCCLVYHHWKDCTPPGSGNPEAKYGLVPGPSWCPGRWSHTQRLHTCSPVSWLGSQQHLIHIYETCHESLQGRCKLRAPYDQGENIRNTCSARQGISPITGNFIRERTHTT